QPRFSGGLPGPPSELSGSCEPPGVFTAALLPTDLPPVRFRLVSRVPQTGLVGRNHRKLPAAGLGGRRLAIGKAGIVPVKKIGANGFRQIASSSGPQPKAVERRE